jgi:hypothetical protein
MNTELDDKGNLIINVFDLFNNLDEETINKMAEIYAWKDPAYRYLVTELRQEYAGKNFNDSIYNFRKAFFLQPMEYDWESPDRDIFNAMKQTIEELLKENAELVIDNRKHNNAKSAVYDYIRTRFPGSDDIAYNVNSVYINVLHGNNNDKERSYVLAREGVEKLDLDKVVQEWCDHVMELFKKHNLEIKKIEEKEE